MQQQIIQQQAHFITHNESRMAPLNSSVGIHQHQQLHAEWRPPATGDASSSSVTITPTSTPPVRVISRRDQQRRRMDRYYGDSYSKQLSPSPLTTETQKRYYEDSTWRMYDRIKSSRPITLKSSVQLLPPHSMSSGASSARHQTSSFAAFPRFSQRQRMMEDPIQEALNISLEGDHQPEDEDEEELIFDLEL